MSQIFKVYNCSITENTITTIYVFVGYDNEKYQSEFMANNKADIFKNIFTSCHNNFYSIDFDLASKKIWGVYAWE